MTQMTEPDHNQNHDNDFNTLLDRSLHNYASDEPRFGLEERILARVNAEATPRRTNPFGRKPAWVWLSAFAGVVVVIVFLLYPHGKSHSDSGQQPNNLAKTQSPISPERHAELQNPAALRTIPSVRRPLPIYPRPAKAPAQPALKPVFGQTQPTRDDLLMAKFISRAPAHAAELGKTPLRSATPISVPVIDNQPIDNQPIAMPAIPMNEIAVAPVEVAEIH